MPEYDNTNSGALFPASNMNVIRQGRIDIQGQEREIVMVQKQPPSGKTVFEMYSKIGAIFPNDQKRNEKDNDAGGSITDPALGDFFVSLWKKTSKAGDPYSSIALTPKNPNPNTPAQMGSNADPTPPIPDIEDEEIPF